MYQIDQFTCNRVVGRMQSGRFKLILPNLMISIASIYGFESVETQHFNGNASRCFVKDIPRITTLSDGRFVTLNDSTQSNNASKSNSC